MIDNETFIIEFYEGADAGAPVVDSPVSFITNEINRTQIGVDCLLKVSATDGRTALRVHNAPD
ncbi:MAG: hypothetical protein AAF623_01170 [Planctomycetota bacterium]